MKFSSQIEKWRSLVQSEAMLTSIPTDFILRWIEVESDGQLNTISEINERGLFQVHPKDEREFLGLSWDDFERLSTDGRWSVQVGLRLVKHYKGLADKKLATWGRSWSGSDYWKLVKLFHGSPVVMDKLYQGVRSALGRAPYTWDELVKIGMANLNGVSPSFAQRVIDNAEKTGSVVTGSRLLPVIIIGSGLVLLYWYL